MYKSSKPIGFWSAVLLGVGAMVGAGIFALLGQAGSIAGTAVWISFLYGGAVAALSGYSFGRLGARYPSAGGLVEYLVRAYGGGFFAGTSAFLLYLSGVLALALIAKAFGSYGSAVMVGTSVPWITNLLALTIIGVLTWINLRGAGEVALFENVVVAIKVTVLCLFIVLGALHVDTARLAFTTYPDQFHIAASIGFTFFAFEGFRVITNTAEDMENPSKQLPRAMMTAILLVAVLYVLMALVVFGNLDVKQAVTAKDYALAEAAGPVFGSAGFLVVGVVAMISTASAINANLYAVTNVAYKMATDGELPAAFGRPIGHSREGLLITAAVIAVLVPTLELSALAVIGSVTILLVHVAVHAGHWRLVRETGASKLLVALAILANAAVIAVVVGFEYQQTHHSLWYLTAFVGAAVLLELLFRRVSGRHIQRRGSPYWSAAASSDPPPPTTQTRRDP
jgi:amino acid transporter